MSGGHVPAREVGDDPSGAGANGGGDDMSTTENMIPHKQRVSEVLQASRRVVNAERRVSRCRTALDAAESELRQTRRALRTIIGDTMPADAGLNTGELS